ncbi:MAG: CDP-diacylglycerol--serine O-phosphatidyltransferase [Ignavibacteriales bacterium]
MQSPIGFLLVQLITFTNLALGVLSILSSDMKLAAIFILAAALVDRMDGKIARRLKSESELGKELDSLSDLVSFGIAPCVIIWKTSLNIMGFWGYMLILLFVIAGTFRLARFNTQNMTGSFLGMPITIAGSAIALLTIFTDNSIVLSILIVILAFLMVSKIKFKKI